MRKFKVIFWVVVCALVVYPIGLLAMSELLSRGEQALGIRRQFPGLEFGLVRVGGQALYRLALFFGAGFVVGRKLTERGLTYALITGGVLTLILIAIEVYIIVTVAVLRGAPFSPEMLKPNLVWCVAALVLQVAFAALGAWVAQRTATG